MSLMRTTWWAEVVDVKVNYCQRLCSDHITNYIPTICHR